MKTIPQIAMDARGAMRALAEASGEMRQAALNGMADKLEGVKAEVFAANAADLAAAPSLSPAFQKRLLVTEKIFAYMLNRLREAAALPDPVGRVLEGRTMPSGLEVRRVAVPIGVVAIIYEARPNVTTDAAAVALTDGTFTGDALTLKLDAETSPADWNIASGLADTSVGFTYEVYVGGVEQTFVDGKIASGDYAGWGFDLNEGVLKFKNLA